MQSDTTANQIFSGEQGKLGKGLELLLVISGWPIVYSVQKTGYALAGDLAGFASIQNWASMPRIQGGKVQNRPEEGGFTIGQMDIDLLDKAIGATGSGLGGHLSAKRYGITDLVSRQAYLQGNASGGFTDVLGADITPSATTVTLVSGANFAGGSVCFIGQEAILLGTKAGQVYTGCTRGYRLTQATRHLGAGSLVKGGFPTGAWTQPAYGLRVTSAQNGVKVYSFLPSLIRRPAFLYKGFTSMSSTAQFLPAFGGVIIGNPAKKGPSVTFSVMGTTWETYLGGKKRIAEMVTSYGGPITATALDADPRTDATGLYTNLSVPEVGNWGTAFANHYLLKNNNGWLGCFSSSIVGSS